MAEIFDCWYRNPAMKNYVGMQHMQRHDFQPSYPSASSGPENPTYFWRTRDYVLLKRASIPATRIERHIRVLLDRWFGRWFGEKLPYPSKFTGYYFSRSKVERVKDWMAVPFGLVFGVAPALLFFYICPPLSRLAILLSFIVGFVPVLLTFLGMTRDKTLATTLGYTAVLGLFISRKTDHCDF